MARNETSMICECVGCSRRRRQPAAAACGACRRVLCVLRLCAAGLTKSGGATKRPQHAEMSSSRIRRGIGHWLRPAARRLAPESMLARAGRKGRQQSSYEQDMRNVVAMFWVAEGLPLNIVVHSSRRPCRHPAAAGSQEARPAPKTPPSSGGCGRSASPQSRQPPP